MPLVFVDAADYERIRRDDRLGFRDLDRLAAGKPVTVEIRHADGAVETFSASHTLTAEQIGWFRAGSALNLIREQS